MTRTEAETIIIWNDRRLKDFIKLVNGKYHFALLYKIAQRIYGDAVGPVWTSRSFEGGRIPDFYVLRAMEVLGGALLFWELKGVRLKAISVLPRRTDTARALRFLVDLAEGVLPQEAIPSQEVVSAVEYWFRD